MAYHKTALFLLLLGCLLTSCGNNVPMPVAISTKEPEAIASPLASQSPTQATPLSQISSAITTSPDGLFVIACQFPELVLFDVKKGTAISRLNLGYSACQRNIRWSRDRLYAILVDQDGIIYQWPTDGSQPFELDSHIDFTDPQRDFGATMTAWSPDEKYLAILKGCNIYITQPFGGTLLQNPLKIEEPCVAGIQWAANNVLMVELVGEYRFYQTPTGANIGHWSKFEQCTEQIPRISPDQHWMIFHQCDTAPHFNQPPNDQYTIANLEQGSVQVFSGMAGDYIDFIGWKDNGAEFYFISRSASPDSSPNPRTPFGLLALNPNTGEISNLFAQAWFAAFNKDLSWAFVVFPAANADGTLRLDGALWQVGTSELKNEQVMDRSQGIRNNGNRDAIFYTNLESLSATGAAILSATGEYLGLSSTFHRLVPAAWSHDNSRVALINAARQVVVIDLAGNAQIIGKLDDPTPGIYGFVAWSYDDKFVILGEKKFPLP